MKTREEREKELNKMSENELRQAYRDAWEKVNVGKILGGLPTITLTSQLVKMILDLEFPAEDDS